MQLTPENREILMVTLSPTKYLSLFSVFKKNNGNISRLFLFHLVVLATIQVICTHFALALTTTETSVDVPVLNYGHCTVVAH